MITEHIRFSRLVVDVVIVHLLVDVLWLFPNNLNSISLKDFKKKTFNFFLPFQVYFQGLVTGGIRYEGGGGCLSVCHSWHLRIKI
jgi:hypothetical protein